MKFSSLKPVVLISLAAVVLFSCSKKSDNKKSNTDYLTAATWKYDNAGLDVNKDGTMETPLPPGVLNDCDKDNTITFQSNGTGTVDEGATKCDPADPQSSPFTWTFKNNETVLNFPSQIFPNFDGDVTIKTLNDTQLVLIKEANLGLPQTVNVIVELKH